MVARLSLIALGGIPLVGSNDNLADVVAEALNSSGEILQDGDVLVIAQKIVSKIEGRIVNLEDVEASLEAIELASSIDKDSRQVELILRESKEIVRSKLGVLIVEQNLGLVMANAGIDHSNIENRSGSENVLLLPENPDESCLNLRKSLKEMFGVSVGIIINDSVGRAWRIGTIGVASGVAGLPAVIDLRGESDLFGRELLVSEQAVADELASAASLIQGQGSEGRPVVLIRGFASKAPHQGANALVRSREMDMFR